MREFLINEICSLVLMIINVSVCVWFYIFVDRTEKRLKKQSQYDQQRDFKLTEKEV